jgi:hypothetical protein
VGVRVAGCGAFALTLDIDGLTCDFLVVEIFSSISLKVVEHGEGFASGHARVASCTGGLPFSSTIYSPSSILSTAAISLRLWWQISSARTLARTDGVCFRAAPFLCPQYFSTVAPRLF